jgi:hypothetical protein
MAVPLQISFVYTDADHTTQVAPILLHPANSASEQQKRLHPIQKSGQSLTMKTLDEVVDFPL